VRSPSIVLGIGGGLRGDLLQLHPIDAETENALQRGEEVENHRKPVTVQGVKKKQDFLAQRRPRQQGYKIRGASFSGEKGEGARPRLWETLRRERSMTREGSELRINITKLR